MKHTPLFDRHQSAGATLVPYAGWQMPVSYAGTAQEVQATRSAVGLFDVSHMGEFVVTGSGAFGLLQQVTSNDIARLQPGQAQYSLLLNPNGGVIDDIIVYRRDDEDYLIVVNAGCKDKDWLWLTEQAVAAPNAVLEDVSDQTALLAVQGPLAVALVQKLASPPEIPRFHFAPVVLAGVPVALSRTGYTGEDGFEIFCPWEQAGVVWDLFTDHGAVPCGLGARDILRLEAAYPLYGHELDFETNALSCGVGWAIKTAKGDFIGKEAILAAKVQGVTRRLVGLTITERAIPREGCLVKDLDGREIGIVTSGTLSPTLGKGIALARIESALGRGTAVSVDIRGRLAPAVVAALPFYRNSV